jgi:tight adherence protein B
VSPVAVLAFVGVATVLGLLLLSVELSGTRAMLRRRARRTGLNRPAGADARRGSDATTLRRSEGRSLPLVENAVRRFLPRQSVLRDRLGRTGYTMTIGTYVLICLILALAGFAALRFVWHVSPLLSVSVSIAAGLGLPHLLVGFLIRRYRSRFIAVFPDAVELIVRGLKAGLPVAESVNTVAREMPQPIAGEFARITDSVRFGRPLNDVLWETARRLDIPEFNFFVISLSIQRETGGNLAETLTNLADILRRRRQIRLKVRALSAEAKASAYILGALPFVMFGLVYWANPDYASMLFRDPRGIAMTCAGMVSMALAALIIFRMIRFEI